jgi:hypothetical protein
MSWYCFQVNRPGQAETVAENLLSLACDPLSGLLLSPDVQVYRRRTHESEIFYFSPAAYLFFKAFILTYHGTACERPTATHDEPELRRMSLRSESRWTVIRPGEINRENGDFPH